MKRFWLYLPVCLLGMPLSVYLVMVSASTEKPVEVKSVRMSEDPLPEKDPLAFLQQCLDRYDREVQGYSCTMVKRERLNGKLAPKAEVIEVEFKEQPFSVFMSWVSGAGLVDRALYVEGENHGKIVARVALFKKIAERDVGGKEARRSGRYTLAEFGIKKGTERTLTAWRAARDAGTLHVEYLGIHQLGEVGDRPCYKLRRTCERPEEDGLTEVVIYIDQETWLQVGSVLTDKDGQLIGQYFFRDVRLNPEFQPDQFTRAALKS